MARGFGATLGVSTSDLISGASFATPTSGSFSAWYNRNGAGGLGNARIFDKEGSTPGEMILRNNNASGTITMSRGFTTTSGQWETSDAEAIATGKWVHIVATWDGVAGNVPIFYINGRLATMTTTTASAGTAKNVSGVLSIGNRTTSGVCWDGLIGNCGFWSNYILTAAEARALFAGADPRNIRPQYLTEYLVFSEARPYSAVKSTQPTVTGTKPRADRLVVAQGRVLPFAQVPASGVNGTASITEASDTAAAVGALALAAAAGITEASDTAASTATLAIAGAASITEAGDTTSSTSTLAIAAALAATEAGDTSSATGAISLSAVASVTEASDTSAATAALAIVANASITEAGDTISATGVGVVTTTGTASITEADDTAASVATLKIAGTSTVTEAGDTSSAAAALAIKGQLAANDNDDTVSATGVTGTVTATVRTTGLRPSDGSSTLRLNLSGGPRPGAISRGAR